MHLGIDSATLAAQLIDSLVPQIDLFAIQGQQVVRLKDYAGRPILIIEADVELHIRHFHVKVALNCHFYFGKLLILSF